MSDKKLKIVELGKVVREKDKRFDKNQSIDSVVLDLLEAHLTELEGADSQAAEERRAALRQKMGISQSDGEESPDDDVAARQAELRERMER